MRLAELAADRVPRLRYRPRHAARRIGVSRPALTVVLVVLVAAAVLLGERLGSPPAAASALSATPAADTYVSSAAPHKNFGREDSLRVSGRHANVEQAFLRFAVSLPAGTVVTSATLRLHVTSTQGPSVISAHGATGDWAEDSLKWGNAPGVDRVAVDSTDRLSDGDVATLDVTPLVHEGALNVALLSDRRQETVIASGEAASFAPELALRFVAPSPTPSATSVSPPPPPTQPPGSGPCGLATSAPATYSHVVWVVMENKSYDQIIGSDSAPYINDLAAKCGLATAFTAETHPSLPNYIAMTSGSTQGITDDSAPAAHPLAVASIFSQTGGNWRSLEESMPTNCAPTSSGDYVVRHNPAAYYTGIATECLQNDVPYTDPPDVSAAFTFIKPNLCNDMHDCSIATGDAWLARELPKIFASPQYQSGSTALFLTWDEGGAMGQHIATVVVSPNTQPGTRSATAFDHYSLLRTTEQLLGIDTFLGSAATAASMRTDFGM